MRKSKQPASPQQEQPPENDAENEERDMYIDYVIESSISSALNTGARNDLIKRASSFMSSKFQLQIEHCINNCVPPLLQYDDGDSDLALIIEAEPIAPKIDRQATIRIPRRSFEVSSVMPLSSSSSPPTTLTHT